jgi:hypothetical protein
MFTFCIECGGYLDRDESICRACGADNAPEAGSRRFSNVSFACASPR